MWACLVSTGVCSGCWQWDGVRQGNYLAGAHIYLNPAQSWTSTKVREVLRHEVGHFMGFSVWYIDTSSPFCYNPSSKQSVMDLAPNAQFGCGDGLLQFDNTDVNALYGFTSISSLVGWDCSSYYGSRLACVNLVDNEPTNSYVYLDYWRCSTPSCSTKTYLAGQ